MKIEIQFVTRGNTTVWNGKLVCKGHTIFAKGDSPMVTLMMLMSSWVEGQILCDVKCKLRDCVEVVVEKGQRDYCSLHQRVECFMKGCQSLRLVNGLVCRHHSGSSPGL